MKISSKKQLSDIVQTWGSILLGNALLAFLVTAFIVPHDFIMAGTTGIGIVISRVLPVDISLVVLVLNVMMLLFGLLVLGKQFFITTVASSLLYPMFLAVMERIPGIDRMTDNSLLAVLYGGALMGVALGMVMRVGSSTGGTDVINLVMHKWLHWPLSICVWTVDITVLAVQALFSNAEGVLYGILLLLLESLTLDKVVLLGQPQIQILVISRYFETIREKLLNELQAGVTMLMIETGRTGEMQKGVLCVIPPRKLFAAKELIYEVDPNAFLTITQIKEVNGEGFSRERHTDDVHVQENADRKQKNKKKGEIT